MRVLLSVLCLFGTLGCGKPVPAIDACHKLEAAGVAANCRDDKPGGLASNAIEGAAFDLPSVPGKGGSVWRFETSEKYDEAVKDYDDHKALAGPHRYGNKKKKLFVQFNDGASMETGATARKTIEAL